MFHYWSFPRLFTHSSTCLQCVIIFICHCSSYLIFWLCTLQCSSTSSSLSPTSYSLTSLYVDPAPFLLHIRDIICSVPPPPNTLQFPNTHFTSSYTSSSLMSTCFYAYFLFPAAFPFIAKYQWSFLSHACCRLSLIIHAPFPYFCPYVSCGADCRSSNSICHEGKLCASCSWSRHASQPVSYPRTGNWKWKLKTANHTSNQ
jgi:hypothetical protein